MDTDKIIQDLNRRFDKLDEVVLENAKVIELTGNNVFCRNLYEARRTNEYVQS